MFEKITSKRLVLRRLVPSDAQKIYEYRSLNKVSEYQNWAPESVHEMESFIKAIPQTDPIAKNQWYQIGITLKNTGNLIGDCGIKWTSENFKQVEIGITISPEYQKNRYAKEALISVIDYLFNDLKLHRIYASIDPSNKASLALFSSLRFRKEAHFKESILIRGVWVDDVIYAILRKEWTHYN